MDPFDIAQSFMESAGFGARGAESTHALTVAFQRALEQLGFRYFACVSHVDPLRSPPGAVVLHNYPDNWVRMYSKRKLHEIDPILLHAERSLVPFFWDAPDFRSRITAQQQRILSEAASLGLDRGYTIPIHMPWRPGAPRASCSVVPISDSIDKRSYHAVHLMAMHLYVAVARAQNPPPNTSPQSLLSLRERQCLEIAVQGMSDWEIGEVLHISEHTVHRHIESAKRRLGAKTRLQAVIRALQIGQISFGDVLRGNGAPSAQYTE